MNRAFFPGRTPEFTKMGEIHELFVLALSLVWFAGWYDAELPRVIVGDAPEQFESRYV